MIQADTGRVLLPLLPMTFHPGFRKLAERARAVPAPRILELEVWSTEEILIDGPESHPANLPGWDVLRFIGGEIAEVYAQSSQAEMLPGEPVLLTGRFVSGLVCRGVFLPNQAESSLALSLVTAFDRATLRFAHGWPGAAEWTAGEESQVYEAFHPWVGLIERFEQVIEEGLIRKAVPGQPSDICLTKSPPALGWQDALRALELDDAARRSVQRGRSNTLDLQETTEEATFKGTMTLVGCSLIWIALVVLIASVWVPWLAWLIVPVFAVFLGMQALRWVVPAR
jgi:hypothetical protein